MQPLKARVAAQGLRERGVEGLVKVLQQAPGVGPHGRVVPLVLHRRCRHGCQGGCLRLWHVQERQHST